MHKFTCVRACVWAVDWCMMDSFFYSWGVKGFVSPAADQVSLWKVLQLLSVFEDFCCSRDLTVDVFKLSFYAWCHFLSLHLKIIQMTQSHRAKLLRTPRPPASKRRAKKTGLFLNWKCLNVHAWAHKQSFGFSSTKSMNNTSVKRVSATCWAPGRSHEQGVSLACCRRWARRQVIPWNHPQGRRCCSSPSPSSASPSPPPLHPPWSTDVPGWCKTQKETKPRAQKNKYTHAKINPNYISCLLEMEIVL